MTGQIDQSWPKPVKKGSKKGQKRVKIGHFGPLFDRSWLGPGSDLRQCSIKYSPFGQNRSKRGQKRVKIPHFGVKMGYFDPFLTGPGSVLAQIYGSVRSNIALLARTAQNLLKSGPKRGPKWPILTLFWPLFGPLLARICQFDPSYKGYFMGSCSGAEKRWSKRGHFGPLFWPLFQLRPAPFTRCLIQATIGVVLQAVLAGLAKPAQRPQKGGQKRGLKWPFAVINVVKWVILEVQNGPKWLKNGSFLASKSTRRAM